MTLLSFNRLHGDADFGIIVDSMANIIGLSDVFCLYIEKSEALTMSLLVFIVNPFYC